jgi:serine protease Do
LTTRTALLLVAGATFGAGLMVAPTIWRSANAAPTADTPLSPTTYNPAQSLAPLVDKLGPAVVHITTSKKLASAEQGTLPFLFGVPDMERPERQGVGSGFLISADGFILTNNHVVEGADKVLVRLSTGAEQSGTVVGTDPRTDIALVKIEGKGLPSTTLGDSNALRVGDWVVAIGNPFGLDHTVTAGIVSAKGRTIGAGPYDDFIQTDASINPGNSGGPLFNLNGEVVGINTAVSRMGQGIGFAVPMAMVKPIIDELRDTGKVSRGWIGVGLQNLDPNLKSRLNVSVDEAVVLSAVYPNTPAAKAGLKAGDVLVRIDGQPVGESDALVREIGTHRPGEKLKLTYLRGGKEAEATVTLAERPAEDDLRSQRFSSSPAPDEQSEGRLGIAVRPTDKGEEPGLVVTTVERGSPAESLLRPGDVILEANGAPVRTADDLKAARKKGDLLLVVARKGSQLLIEVPGSK